MKWAPYISEFQEINTISGDVEVLWFMLDPPKQRKVLIRDFPDHATFREKGAKLACADKLGVFLSLSLFKNANFEYLSFIK